MTLPLPVAVAAGATLPRTHAFKFEDGLLEERVTLQAPRVELAGPQGAAGATQTPSAAAGAAAGAPGGAVLTATCALEYVYDQRRVVHRGALRATFSAALKARAFHNPQSRCRCFRTPDARCPGARGARMTARHCQVEALELCLRGHELVRPALLAPCVRRLRVPPLTSRRAARFSQLLPRAVLARPVGALAELAREVEARARLLPAHMPRPTLAVLTPLSRCVPLPAHAQAREGESSAEVAASLASYAALLSAAVSPEEVTPLGFTQRHVRCLQLADVACASAPVMDLQAATRAGPQQQLACSRLLSTPHDDGTAAGAAAVTGFRPPWPMSAEWQAVYAALSAAISGGLADTNGAGPAQDGAGKGSSHADRADGPASRRRRGMPDPQEQPLQRRRRQDIAVGYPAPVQPPVAVPPPPPSLAAWAMAMTSRAHDVSRRNELPDDRGGGNDTDEAFLYGIGGTVLSPPRFPSIDELPPMAPALFEQMLRDAALP